MPFPGGRPTLFARLRGLLRRSAGFTHSAAFFPAMHLLYLDDSGSAGNPTEEYLVLGGVSVFEAQADWITLELDKLA